eukprot:11209333-Lingulodinium_polyedra.AAC.1
MAWMIWRTRFVPSWLEARRERARLFQTEVDRLLEDTQHLQPQSDGLLGHGGASQASRNWVPRIARM